MAEPHYEHLQARLEQGVLVLTITLAQLQDEKTAAALQEELAAAVDYFRSRKVVVNLEPIRYISSVAFRPLLSLRRKMLDSGGRLLLCGLSSVVGDVFYTTRLVSSGGSFAAPFELQADVSAAVARLNAVSPLGGE